MSLGSLLLGLVGLLLISALALGETSLGLDGEFSLLSVVFVGSLFHLSNSEVVGVKSFHGFSILQGVLLLGSVKGSVFLLVSDNALDGIGVDDLSDISVGKDSSVEVVSGLLLGSVSVSTEDFIKSLEGRFSPDDESSDVTTGSELLKVKSVDVSDFNTGEVSNSSEEGDVFVAVDKEGTSSKSVSLVSELTLTRSDVLGVGNSFNIIVSTESLQESNGILSLFDTFELVIDNQRKHGDVLDSVTSSANKGSDSGSSKSSSDGVSLLLDVDLSVESSPGLQRGEHATLSDGVGEGTLSGSVGTGTTNSGNSGNGTTRTPRDSGVLHTGLSEDSVRLSDVLGDLIVNELDNIESDGSSADSREGDLAEDFSSVGVVEDGDGGSGEHFGLGY